MRNKLIALAAVMAMLCQFMVPVYAADAVTVLNDTFDDGTLGGYEVYDASVVKSETPLTIESGGLKLTAGNEYNSNNGVKKDITALLKSTGFTSGDVLNVSLDMSCSWYDNPATVFVEVNGVKTVLTSGGPGGETWTKTTLAGGKEVTYSDGDTVYFCITQGCDTHAYDNIKLSFGGQTPVTPTVAPTTPTDKPSDTPTGAPEADAVLNDTFDDGADAGYKQYDETAAVTISYENGAMKIAGTGDNASWAATHGAAKDITSLVKSGTAYSVSADVKSTAWGDNPGDGPAKLFFEVVSGETAKKISIGSINEDGTVSGKAAPTFGSSDKVFLCITQNAGEFTVDNVKITMDAQATTAPTAAPEDDTILDDTFDSTADAGYEQYDADNAAEITYNGEKMDVKLENGWSTKNGVKKDITALVKTGTTYSASADIHASAWGDNPGDGPAKLFFEVVSGTNKKQINIGSVNEDGTISGSAALAFNSGDMVYICVTQPSGYYQIDNVKIKAESKPPVTPTDAPVGDDALEDTFSDGNISDYVVYDDADTAAEVMVSNGRLLVNFGSQWDSNNGVKKNITSLVKSGSKYEVTADFETTYWGDKKAKLFFEIVPASGASRKVSLYEALGDGESGPAALKGTGDLRFDAGDTVYLCITQGAGTQYYDNIIVKRVGDADPEATKDPSTTPEPTARPIGDTIFTDDFSDVSQGDKYKLYTEYTDADSTLSVSGGKLNAAMGADHSWSESNGIRRDITEEVSQYISGMTFGAHVELDAYWNSDAKGKIFFETVGADGLVSTMAIADFPIPDEQDAVSIVEGAAQLNYKPGDTVYLCATQMSGNHVYDNISLWIESSGGGNATTLTSGIKRGGEFFPASANVIFSDTFSGSTVEEIAERYTSFNNIPFAKTPDMDQGGALFHFPNGEGSVHGVAVDVTDAFDKNLPNGGTARVGCKMMPYWWWCSASVKLRIDGTTINVVDYTSKTNDPGGVWTPVNGVTTIERSPGQKTELIITMNAGTASDFRIDDVCVELPYDTVMARDIAIKSTADLADISSVDIVYGGSYVSSSPVKWGAQSGNVVYGETDIDGVTARAFITDGNVKKVTVTKSGITMADYKLEPGKTAGASGDNEMVFLLDNMNSMNLMSAVSGTGDYITPQSGTTDKAARMSVSDNGSGITIEGTIPEAAYNDEIIFIKNASGTPVSAEYVHIGADGKYSVKCAAPAKGEYTVAMTDTGVSTKFAYASASDFEAFKNKAVSGQAVGDLLRDNDNRIALGAGNFAQYDALSSSAQAAVCTGFAAQLANKTRAQAAALFDSLVTIQAAASVPESDWTKMLDDSAEELGLRGTSVYSQYTALPPLQRESVKSKTASQNPSDADSFKNAFSGAVLNTRLMNAGNYTNIQSILRENAVLFDGTGANVSGLSANAAKYINSHITANDITISSLASLINAAIAYANSNTGSSGSSGGFGGSGGGGGGYYPNFSNNSSGMSGSNLGLGVPQNTVPNQTTGTQFTDLAGYEWAQGAVYDLSGRGIINGYGDGTFNPGGSITREEFVKIIVSAFNIPTGDASSSFADVDSGRWSYDVISAAVKAGIVTGISDTEFAPSANITRQDAAVIIYRALNHAGKSLNAGDTFFTDSSDIASYAAEAVTALSGAGVINGMEDGSFAPTATTTRAQAAVMIYRVISTLL